MRLHLFKIAMCPSAVCPFWEGYRGRMRWASSIPTSPLNRKCSRTLTTRCLCSCHHTWRGTWRGPRKPRLSPEFSDNPHIFQHPSPLTPCHRCRKASSHNAQGQDERACVVSWLTIPWATKLRISNFWTAMAWYFLRDTWDLNTVFCISPCSQTLWVDKQKQKRFSLISQFLGLQELQMYVHKQWKRDMSFKALK